MTAKPVATPPAARCVVVSSTVSFRAVRLRATLRSAALVAAALLVLLPAVQAADGHDAERTRLAKAIERQLQAWHVELDRLTRNAEKLSEQGQAQYRDEVEKLRQAIDRAERLLEETRQHTGDSWQRVQERVQKSWGELNATVERIRAALSGD